MSKLIEHSAANLGIVPFSQIEFGERFRIEYGDLPELAASIKAKGLMHPLVVKRTSQDSYLLLAGGRRYKAIELLQLQEVPVRIYNTDLSEYEIRAIELTENIQRLDFDWREKARLEREIHELYTTMYGEAHSGTKVEGEGSGWSMDQTAEMLGKDRTTLSKDIALAKMLEINPEMFDTAKNKSEAVKIAKKMEERLITEELARRSEAERAKRTGASKAMLSDKFIIESCLSGMRKIPTGSMNLCEIDPPYSIDLTSQKRQLGNSATSTLDHYNEINKPQYLQFMSEVLREAHRCMAEHSWLILWFAHEPWFEPIFQLAQGIGFQGNRMVGIWVKPNGQTQQPQTYLANCTEMFFYLRKGSPAIHVPGHTNTFIHSPLNSTRKIHPTERPVELIKDILGTFVPPGSRILVPFLGSGVTLYSADQLGMDAIGFELSKEYKDSFIVRLHKGEW